MKISLEVDFLEEKDLVNLEITYDNHVDFERSVSLYFKGDKNWLAEKKDKRLTKMCEDFKKIILKRCG